MELTSNGTEDRERRIIIQTEKGADYHDSLKTTLLKKLSATTTMLTDCIDSFEPFPKSLPALDSAETSLQGAFDRYDSIANEYLNFMSRSLAVEDVKEVESYWPKMTKIKKICNQLFDKILLARESFEVKSQRSSRTSNGTTGTSGSRVSSLAAAKRAKAVSERVKLQFIERETKLKKEQFDKTLELQKLEQQKNTEAAEAEASCLEKQIENELLGETVQLPKEEVSPFDRTVHYLEGLMKPDSVPPQPLSVKAKPFTPQNSAKTSPLIDFISSTPAVPSKETKPRQTTFNHENLQIPSGIQYDNLQNQTGIQYDSQCSSTEMLESALKTRIMKIPDHVDRRQLYELHDLLKEIEAVKNIDEYSLIFSYLDSSLGIRPIVQKLPRQIQEKWITRVVNYKKRHQVLFPPFSEFVAFIGETSVIRNDPGLIYDAPKETFQNRKPISKPTRPAFSSRKTDVLSGTPINSRHPCLIHKNTKHTINECKAFRAKSIDDRKALIKSNNICLRCCDTSSHFANRCKMKLECDICKSERHCTALHVDSSYESRGQHPPRSHGEESQSNETTVETKCTEICGNFRGKSCARILPVRIFVAGKRHRSTEGYAMLDDQSNKTLGKSELFNNLSIESEFVEYTMQSCSGKTVNSGRIAEGLCC